MGCNSSTVIPTGETETSGGAKVKVPVNSTNVENKKVTSTNGLPKNKTSVNSETTFESSKPPLEVLSKDLDPLSGDQKVKKAIPPPLAFDVSLQEDSIIKKHPPKKFRQLSSQQSYMTKTLTHEELNNKLHEAEMRRREVLNQRIRSAQQKNSQYRQLIPSDALSQKSEETITLDTNTW